MIEKILVTLDGSELAEIVVTEVEKLAAGTDVEVILLSIIPPVAARTAVDDGPSVFVDELVARANADAKDYLSEVAEPLRRKGFKVRTDTRYGQVTEEIVDFARDSDVDLIAMCTHGRTGLERWIRGSVAEKVMRTAHVPVLLVKPTPAALAKRALSKHRPVAAN